MLQRIITVALLAGVGYWYWSGPYQERVNPTPEKKLLQNSKNMLSCFNKPLKKNGMLVYSFTTIFLKTIKQNLLMGRLFCIRPLK